MRTPGVYAPNEWCQSTPSPCFLMASVSHRILSQNTLKMSDLFEIIEEDLGHPMKRSGANLFWHCPFHPEKTPSFTVHPSGAFWKCFGCGAKGDLIEWLRRFRGASFKDATAVQNGDIEAPRTNGRRKPTPHPDTYIPNDLWRRKALEFITYAQQCLANSASMQAYLTQERGILPPSWEEWHIGVNPTEITEPGVSWGLPDNPSNPGGNIVTIPPGIVLPWYTQDKNPVALKVRVFENGFPRQTRKYGQARRDPGVLSGLYGVHKLQHHRYVLITEGEFDAILCSQFVENLADVVAVSSASQRPNDIVLSPILLADAWLVCMDADKAGETGRQWWEGRLPWVRTIRVIKGKDPTEFWKLGGDIRSWIEGEIERLGLSLPIPLLP